MDIALKEVVLVRGIGYGVLLDTPSKKPLKIPKTAELPELKRE